MVAIVTGKGVGLERSSAWVLGSRGQLGSAMMGRDGERVYVNAASGNLVITRQDEFLVGLGPDTSIDRTYNSQATVTDGDNGDNWQASPYRRIIGTNGAATITRVDWDGSETIFNAIATNNYISPDGAGSYDKLLWGGTQWTWTDGNSRTTEVYDTTGKLLSTRDADGNLLTYTYSSGRVVAVTNADNERTQLVYGGTGGAQLQKVGAINTTSGTVRTYYGYDASNRLQTVTLDLTPGDQAITDGNTYVTTYGYDGASKRVNSISQADGSVLQIGYTAFGSDYRVTSLTETVAGGVTRVTTLTYDLVAGTTQIKDPLGGVTTMAYDAAGNLTQVVMPAPTPGAAAPTTSYTYNANGDLLSMTENGLTTDYQYDGSGNLTLMRDAAGNTVTRTYGFKSELLTSTEYLVPDPDGIGPGAPGTPVTTRYAYDIENHLRFAVDGEGEVTEYRYDAPGQQTSKTVYAGNKYPVAGLAPTATLSESTLAAWVADPGTDKSNARRTDTNFDSRGNIRSEVTYSKLSATGQGSTSPLEIVTGVNTSTSLQSDGLYRLTKTGFASTAFDADARGTVAADGDFVLRVRPPQNNKYAIAGVSPSPSASTGYNLNYAFYFQPNGWYTPLEGGQSFIQWQAPYVAGDNFWLVRTGTTINYYKGATLEAAMAAGSLRTKTGATGTFYFDSSFYNTGDTVDVSFTPLTIANGANTSVVLQTDRTYRVTKTGGVADSWDSDARSSNKADGDFVLRLRPPQSDKYVVGGVSTAPAASSSYTNPEYGFYFQANGQVNFMESGNYAGFATPVTYAAGDNFWLVRTGNTLTYYKGATLDAAKAAGALRTRVGVAGTFYFDSSIYTAGGALDVAFTPDDEASSVIYLYDQAGQLLSRMNGSSGAQETFLYDGLGRVTSMTDMANATTTFVFNDAATTTTATIAGGLTRVSLYNKVGELVSVTESGSNIATAADTDSYDALGRLRMHSGPTGVTTYYVYDNAGRKVADVGTDGAMTEYVYDANSRLAKTIGYANKLNATQIGMLDDFTAGGDGSGSPVDPLAGLRPAASATDDRYEWRIYDSANRLIETIDGAGSATVNSYDGASLLVATTAYATQFGAGTLAGWKTTGPSALVAPTADARDRVTRHFYDNAGNQIGTLDGEGGLSENVYDGGGLLIETIGYATATNVADRAAGSFATLKSGVTAATNPKDIHNWLVYDSRGLLRGRIDGEGNLTRYHYSAAGDIDQMVRGQKLDPTALIATRPVFATLPTSAGGQVVETTNYNRDGAGRALSEIRVFADGTSSATTYSYDLAGRLLAQTEAYGTADAHTVTQRYDARGNLIGELGGEGSTALAALGANPSAAAVDNVYATWGTVYSYDSGSRLLVRARGNGVNGANRSLYYYNSSDQLAFEVNALGEVVEYRYDARGERTDTIAYATRVAAGTLAGMTGGNVTSAVAATMAALANSALDTGSHTDFNVDGTVKQTSDPLGNLSTYSYTAFGELSAEVTARDGAATIQTTRIYDRRGLLNTEIVDSAAGGKAISTTYGYDALGRVVSLTNALNKTASSVYDRDGRLISQTQSPDGGTTLYTTFYTYDARNNLVAVTDALSKITRYVYDKAGRRIATIDALGGLTTTTYDAAGRAVVSRAYYNTVNTASLPLEVTEAALTLPSSSAADHITRYAYDKDGQLRFTVDGLMHVVETAYDVAGNAIRTIAYDGVIAADPSGVYSAGWIAGQVAALAGGNTRTTRSVYDAGNRLSYAIDAIGQICWYNYDSAGRLIKQVELAALYTAAGDPSVAAMDSWRASNANTATDRTTRAYYDRKGQLSYSIDALGFVTRLEYDKLGNVRTQSRYEDAFTASDSTTLANLNSAFAAPPATTRITQFNYDSAGRLEETIDPEGYSTKLVLDALGQITSSTAAYGLSAASVTTYTYDDIGRMKSETRGFGSAEVSVTAFDYDALGRLTQRTAGYGTADAAATKWEYDELGRVTKQTRGFGSAEAGQTQTFYDAFDRVTSTIDGRGSVVSRTYDIIDELKTETEELEAGTADDRTTAYTYDSFGNAVKVNDARGNDSFAYYDKLGRVFRQVDAAKYVSDTSYTRGGRMASIKHWANAATGTLTETVVPADPTADSLRDATTVFTYDRRDELTAVQDAAGYTESYTLNAFGERVQVRNKLHGSVVNGVTLDTTVYYTFDKRGLVKSETLPVTTTTSGGATISVVNSYEYDARGNRTKMTEADGAAEVRTTGYEYDKLDRLFRTTHDAVTVVNDDLTTTNGVTPTETVKYDRRGNVIEKVDAGGARSLYWYDHLDHAIAQLAQTHVIDGVGKGTLSRTGYDGNGNITSLKVFGDPVSLPADATGAVPGPVDSTNYRLTSYAYYRDDRLWTTTVAGLVTGEFSGGAYALTGSDVVSTLEYDKAGNITHQEDGRGNDIWSWYDKVGRKTAEVDAENYLTVWVRDAEGNATAETRYATQLPPYTPGASPPSIGATAADRVTSFEYDKDGRRTKEQRLGVAYTAINAATGDATDYVASDGSAISTVQYTYNGLGQVLTKTEANNDLTSYTYDTIGRLTLEADPSFTDYQDAGVTPRTAYRYDGLNNLRSTRVQMAATANDTNDRITTYSYGAGGRLASMTDAANFTHGYGYDAAGRLVRDSYTRLRSDGVTATTEAQVTRYDLAGRAIVQSSARLNGSTWLFTDAAGAAYDAIRIRYNAFGEVSGRGLTAGPGAAAAYQETFDYDGGGRLWRSNSGDGALRFYVYDKAGNQTLTLASTGADLSSLALDNYTASITGSGGTTIAGAVTTIGVFDRRGQQIQTREPDRQLSAGATALLVHGRTYNAFGEVASEISARGFDAAGNATGTGYTTTYGYNTMGRLLTKVSPQVSVTGENGAISSANPTETYGYDLAGRLVSVTNANGFRTSRLLLAGTGLAGSEASVLKEFHPDTGVFERKYDVFGAMRVSVNEMGKTETFGYDKMNRLIEQDHPLRAAGSLGNATGVDIQLIDQYAYDGLGRRTQKWNSLYGAGVAETTDYDIQGRVEKMVNLGGAATSTTYSWSSTAATAGLGTFGGWTKTTLAADGTSQTDVIDYFGRMVDRTDAGGHDYDLTFDAGGRLVSQIIVGNATTSFGWFNTGMLASESANGLTAAYGYDGDGRRTLESYGSYQNATVTWDALGRMTSFSDTGGAAPASITFEYDLVGNVRHRMASYSSMDADGATYGPYTQDYWYLYDNMNRFKTTRGALVTVGGVSSITGGTEITYYADGNRKTASQTVTRTKPLHKYVPTTVPHTPRYYDDNSTMDVPDDGQGAWSEVDYEFDSGQVETYSYSADGYLAQVSVATEDLASTGNGGRTNPGAGALGPSLLRGDYAYDAMGRVTAHSEYNPAGTPVYSRTASYDALSQVITDTVNSLVGSDWLSTVTNYFYSTPWGQYLGGALDHTVASNSKNYALQSTVTTTNSYVWWDGPRQLSSTEATDNVSTTDTSFTSTYYYDGLGHLSSVYAGGGRPRTISFVTDIDGKVLQRDEEDGLPTGDPRELHYYFNGNQLGDVSNNGTSDIDYVSSIAEHTAAQGQGPFRDGSNNASAYSDFDQSYDPINGLNYASTASHYTTSQGDTLQGIAQAMWGDSSLWYLIADANGLSGSEQLVAGVTLSIPNKVTNVHNSSDTFRVYDPNKALGDLSPTAPKPPKAAAHHGCGIVGTILLVAVAVAVTIVTSGAALAALSPAVGSVGMGISVVMGTAAAGVSAGVGLGTMIAAGAIGGALGSIASQGVGIATGLQDKFSWKGVAMGAISGAIGAGLGKFSALSTSVPGQAAKITGTLGKIGQFLGKGTFLAGAARGGLTSVLTQGIGVAAGLQNKFDFAGVAAAAVGGGVSNALGARITNGDRYSVELVTGGAGALANAATRTLIDGSDFGDNILAALPDVIGSTLGNIIAGGIASIGSSAAAAHSHPEAASAEVETPTDRPADYPDMPLRGETPEQFRERQAAFVRSKFRPAEPSSQQSGPLSMNFDTVTPSGRHFGYAENGTGIFANNALDAMAGGELLPMIIERDEKLRLRGTNSSAADYIAYNVNGNIAALEVFRDMVRSTVTPHGPTESAALASLLSGLDKHIPEVKEQNIVVSASREQVARAQEGFFPGLFHSIGDHLRPAYNVVRDASAQYTMAQMQFYDPRLRTDPHFQQAYASVSATNGQRMRAVRDGLLGFGTDLLLTGASTMLPSLRSAPVFSDANRRMEGRVVSAVTGTLHTAQDTLFDLASVHDNLLYGNPGAAGRSLGDAGVHGTELALDVLATRGATKGLRLAGETTAGRVTVFRVEGATNSRFAIDEAGNVSLTPGNNKTIWLNFGEEGRATSYLERKVADGLPDAHLKSFEVDARFLDDIRATAVPENLARRSPGSPIISRDPFPNQYGIRQDQFQSLLDSIHPGTGKYVRPGGN